MNPQARAGASARYSIPDSSASRVGYRVDAGAAAGTPALVVPIGSPERIKVSDGNTPQVALRRRADDTLIESTMQSVPTPPMGTGLRFPIAPG